MTRLKGLTARLAILVALMLPVAACTTPSGHGRAICERLSPRAAEHGRSLLNPATPDEVVLTGEPLVLGLLAACR